MKLVKSLENSSHLLKYIPEKQKLKPNPNDPKSQKSSQSQKKGKNQQNSDSSAFEIGKCDKKIEALKPNFSKEEFL